MTLKERVEIIELQIDEIKRHIHDELGIMCYEDPGINDVKMVELSVCVEECLEYPCNKEPFTLPSVEVEGEDWVPPCLQRKTLPMF